MKKFIFLFLGLFCGSSLMRARNITFECADGYKVNTPGVALELQGGHTMVCADNPYPQCCECILGQRICNARHGGLKPGSFPVYCNTACKNSGYHEALSHLNKKLDKIPEKERFLK